jgi:hypothetical protein
MIITHTSDSDFYISSDFYPYEETRNKIIELSEWFNHPSRGYIENNYDLESRMFNSLRSSLEDKLKTGMFNFLYYKGECIAFCGLQLFDDSAWSHRLFISPLCSKLITGAVSTFIFPHQTVYAINKECRYYKHTFNKKNIRFYRWYKERLYIGRLPEKYIRGSSLLSRYEYCGTEIINNYEQLVCRLDLQRPDIQDFCLL